MLPDLLRGNETRVWGDQADRGQRAVIRRYAPRARDFVNRRYRHCGVVDEERAKNRSNRRCEPKSSIRSGLSSGCSALPRCASAGSRRTLIVCSWPAPWPICLWRAGICCAARRRRVPALRQYAAQTTQYPPRPRAVARPSLA